MGFEFSYFLFILGHLPVKPLWVLVLCPFCLLFVCLGFISVLVFFSFLDISFVASSAFVYVYQLLLLKQSFMFFLPAMFVFCFQVVFFENLTFGVSFIYLLLFATLKMFDWQMCTVRLMHNYVVSLSCCRGAVIIAALFLTCTWLVLNAKMLTPVQLCL